MKKLLLLIVFIIPLYCVAQHDNRKEILIKKFPVEKYLHGQNLVLENGNCPNYIAVFDTVLFVMQGNCENTFFHFFSTNNFKPLGKIGMKGKGPKEFLRPLFFKQYYVGRDNFGFWCFDLQTMKFTLISIDKTFPISGFSIEQVIMPPPETDIITSLIYLSDSRIVGTSTCGKGRLFFLNPKNDNISWIDNFPKVSRLPPETKVGYLYYNELRVKPDKSRIVSGMRLFKRIDIFYSDGNLDFSIVFPKQPEPNLRNPNMLMPRNTNLYYFDIFLTNKYIYGLNLNMTHGEKLENSKKEVEIHVLDWNGTPICLYHLDQPIDKFVIDEKNKIIYGINDNNEIPVVKFRIGNELDIQ